MTVEPLRPKFSRHTAVAIVLALRVADEVEIRENLSALAGLVEEVDSRRLSFCTDGTNASDRLTASGVSVAAREAMALGVGPVTAVRMATLNTIEASASRSDASNPVHPQRW